MKAVTRGFTEWVNFRRPWRVERRRVVPSSEPRKRKRRKKVRRGRKMGKPTTKIPATRGKEAAIATAAGTAGISKYLFMPPLVLVRKVEALLIEGWRGWSLELNASVRVSTAAK